MKTIESDPVGSIHEVEILIVPENVGAFHLREQSNEKQVAATKVLTIETPYTPDTTTIDAMMKAYITFQYDL